jgi:ubiquinone/menaquinone biosynthesis C-methylase UbiE
VSKPRVDTDSLRAVYGNGAASYDALWHPVIRPPALALIRALALDDATRVLDVGAGTGALTAPIRAAAPRASIVSVDASPAMLLVARERTDAIVCLADASRLPFPAAHVDAVLLAYVLFHLLDPADGVREAARVLRAGGTVGTVTWARESQPRASAVWDEALAALDIPTLPDHGKHTGLDREDDIRLLLDANGLATKRVWREPIEHTFTPESYLRLRTGGGSGRARLAAVDPTTSHAAITQIRDRLRALQPDDFTFRGEVICAVSRKAA